MNRIPGNRFLPLWMALVLASCTGDRPTPGTPPPAPAAEAAKACVVEHFQVANLRVDGQSCRYSTGHWHLRPEPALPGLALWRDDERIDTVLQLFPRDPEAPIDALLDTLRTRGHIPPDRECVFEPTSLWAAPRTIAFFQIKPIGERLRRLKATPRDEVPDPPCGDYGWSTHGVRYFLTDLRAPEWAVYVNEGQDGTLVDPRTLHWGEDGAR